MSRLGELTSAPNVNVVTLVKSLLYIYLLYFGTLLTGGQCFVIRLVQKGSESTFNYTNGGLIVSAGGRKKCMPEIGCFSGGEPFFHPIYRPISVLPQDRDEIATAFLLYTRDDPFMFRFLRAGDPFSITKSGFRIDEAETKVIVPGWMDSMKVSTWMQDMKDALLNYDDCNVIIVDWSKTNSIPFALAVANTRVVGAEIALLINFLQDHFGLEPETVHIIGHSLGTEIAGYAGQRITNLGRISALDPAGPYFRNVSNDVKLDPSDAIFVDAIHCQSSDIGAESPSRFEQTGHIDFYPNGGETQPGCSSSSVVDTFVKKGILEGARDLVVCDHYKAIDYFMATIPNHYGCNPIGVACNSWQNFVNGKCGSCGQDGSLCATMGFSADVQQNIIKSHPPRKFFLYTSNRAPYCVQQYHVSVKLGDVGLFPSIVGQLYVKLNGKFGSVLTHVNPKNGLLRTGKVYATVTETDENIDVEHVTFYWECATFKLTTNIQLNINGGKQCQLKLHSIRITTYKINPNILMFCGPRARTPPEFELHLGPEAYC